MSLRDRIIVNTQYTRSINLERDATSAAVISSYIPTSRAVRTLDRVAESFKREDSPRAWSLIGPYGSGKSSFSVFLSQLLNDSGEESARLAQKILRKSDRSLASKYGKEVSDTAGYLEVLVTGSPEPLAKRLLDGLVAAARQFWEGRRGPNNRIVAELEEVAAQKTISTTEIVSFVARLQEELAKVKGRPCRGILLVIDELGKFLEYESRHYGANDIYLLQALAEHAYKAHDINFLMFALLHQSFEQYAKGLGDSLKNEWAKVQGRFEEVPFLESSEQVLRVVGAAFDSKLNKTETTKLRKSLATIVKDLNREHALPGALQTEEAIDLFAKCYPLHPVTSLLLPLLCQKVAQNERTLFSYLGSHEEAGLQQLLGSMDAVGEWIYPHHIYDYFITNQPSVMGDYLTHRRWAEVVTAVERLGDANTPEAHTLKTIGLLNIVGSKGGFKASEAVLATCAPTKKQAAEALKELRQKSIITFRKFNNEFRVWQGSDFDLEASLQEELNKLGNFNLAEELNRSEHMLPVVARKYTIKSGALRYFTPTFVDANDLKQGMVRSTEPHFLFYLATAQDDIKYFYKNVRKSFTDLDIVALCFNGSQLRDATAEVKGLELVEAHCQELQSDAVARREFEDRLSAAKAQQRQLLEELIKTPANNEWYWRGAVQAVGTRRDLQRLMSDVLEAAYNKAPIFHNELINRDKPSSQAAAGRNKLLFAMLKAADQTDLGIDKFPPEKAMYRSLLWKHGLHKEAEFTQWELAAPGKKSSVYPVWQRIEQFFESTEKAPQTFEALTKELTAPPYGVKEGVLPILYICAMLVNEHELAVYENRRYVPQLTEELIERFLKRPDEYVVQRFRIEGLRKSIFNQYSKALFGENFNKDKRSILDFAKPLARFIGELDDFTKRTKSSELSAEARRLRDAFNLAKSPENLLFEALPSALGFDPQRLETEGDKALEGFSARLMECLRELKYCLQELQNQQKVLLAQAFHMDPATSLEELQRKLAGRYEGLDEYTVDIDGIKAFIRRLTKKEKTAEEWFKNLLMFLGQKPVDKWTDADRSEAEIKLSDYSKRILDLEALRLHYDRTAKHIDGDFDVILLKSLKKGQAPLEEVVAIDKNRRETIQGIKEKMRKPLEEFKDKELQLAAVAELADEFLNEYRQSQSKQKSTKPRRLRKVENG